MKIRFTKKRLRNNLLLGIIWMVFGVAILVFSKNNSFVYVNFGMGILYIGTFLFENTKQYLTIENGSIVKNKIIPKKLNFTDITQIKKFAGAYILKTEKTELRINTEIIEEDSLSELRDVLEKLALK